MTNYSPVAIAKQPTLILFQGLPAEANWLGNDKETVVFIVKKQEEGDLSRWHLVPTEVTKYSADGKLFSVPEDCKNGDKLLAIRRQQSIFHLSTGIAIASEVETIDAISIGGTMVNRKIPDNHYALPSIVYLKDSSDGADKPYSFELVHLSVEQLKRIAFQEVSTTLRIPTNICRTWNFIPIGVVISAALCDGRNAEHLYIELEVSETFASGEIPFMRFKLSLDVSVKLPPP